MKHIGTGQFSKAYRLDSGNVLVYSNDIAKEVICMFGTDNPYLPNITHANFNYPDKPGYNSAYIMPYYGENLRKNQVSSQQWSYYRLLQDKLMGGGIRRGNYWYAGRTRQEHMEIIEGLALPPVMKQALIDLCNCMANASQRFSFEFSPRNVRARYNRLFFMDCVFVLDRQYVAW